MLTFIIKRSARKCTSSVCGLATEASGCGWYEFSVKLRQTIFLQEFKYFRMYCAKEISTLWCSNKVAAQVSHNSHCIAKHFAKSYIDWRRIAATEHRNTDVLKDTYNFHEIKGKMCVCLCVCGTLFCAESRVNDTSLPANSSTSYCNALPITSRTYILLMLTRMLYKVLRCLEHFNSVPKVCYLIM